jgi:hypothetical protein
MSYSNLSIDGKLAASQQALANAASNPEIAALLAGFGYDAARIAEGQALYDAAQAAQVAQKQEYGEQYAASQAFETAWKTANETYMQLVKVARVAFSADPNAATALGIAGRRKPTYSGWLEQAQIFYTTALANAAFQTELARFGVTLQKLQDGQALVAAVVAAKQAQGTETAEAQAATQARDNALEALDAWMSDFIAIAKIALEGTQLSEALGILERS